MRITIFALGSRGDVQPFIPLSKGLIEAGHQVCIATFEAFASMVKGAGINFSPIHGNAQGLLNQAVDGNLLSKRTSLVQTMQALRKSYGTLAKSLPDDLPALYDSDLILNQLPAHLFGGDLASYLKIPWAIVSVIPLVRTRFQPLIGFPTAPSFFPGYNRLTYRLGEQIGWQLFRKTVNSLRRKTWGLPATPFWGSFDEIERDRIPVVCGFSEHVVPRHPDCGNHIHLTGWWYPDDPQWDPPIALQRFIEDGSPPIFIGFGSMPVRDPVRTTNLIVEAVRMSGQRAVLHAGWAGLGGDLPAEIFSIDYAPYGWLFPRMAAVVHHGGSGTTGFGFLSGVPSIFVPFGFDQFYWGARAFELGVGPKPVPFRQLSAKNLASAIHQAVTEPGLQRCSAKLGQKLSKENGVRHAVEIISAL